MTSSLILRPLVRRPRPQLLDTLEISGDYNIILTTRPRGTIPANLWACSYFIFIGPQN